MIIKIKLKPRNTEQLHVSKHDESIIIHYTSPLRDYDSHASADITPFERYFYKTFKELIPPYEDPLEILRKYLAYYSKKHFYPKIKDRIYNKYSFHMHVEIKGKKEDAIYMLCDNYNLEKSEQKNPFRKTLWKVKFLHNPEDYKEIIPFLNLNLILKVLLISIVYPSKIKEELEHLYVWLKENA